MLIGFTSFFYDPLFMIGIHESLCGSERGVNWVVFAFVGV